MKPTFISALLAVLSFSLNAQEWVRQNPFAHLSQMFDISFDGRHGLAVGDDATIFTTTNFGSNWTQRKAPQQARAIEAALVVPGTMGQLMFAGGDSLMMVSRNGGETWDITYVEIPNIYKIQHLPGNIILALGKDFGIYSTDLGLLWQPFNMPAFGVTAGHFLNTLKGWVALGDFDNVKVYRTLNSGFNWEIISTQVFPLVTGLEMLNDSVGFLAAIDYVYKTIDGGKTWWPLHNFATTHIQDLFIVNEDHLWTSLDDGRVFFSNTGGSTWQVIDPKLIHTNRTLAIWANTSGRVWTVGKYLSILYSPDFGQTWTDQIPGNKQTLFAPDFHNAFIGMVGASDGTIMKTDNSGATWLSISFPTIESFHGLDMVGPATAIAGSYTGRVFITHDQGVTWEVMGQDLGKITGLHAFNAQTVIVINEEGDIYKTSNGGIDWAKTFDGALVLYGLHFYNASLGWATGISGRVLYTSDGGNTWAMRFNEGQTTFTDAFFITPTVGWMTSGEFTDSIWHTFDGGITWEEIGLPMFSYWQGVSFMDSDTGWVVGGTNGNGIILRTNNQGKSWFSDHTSPDAFTAIYSIPNSETAWAVGYGGNIMKYSSCMSPPLITNLRADLQPCESDTVNYVVEFVDVDVFDWIYPPDWQVVGNTNTASIHFIVGGTPGEVSIQGSDACGDSTEIIKIEVIPVPEIELVITEESGVLVSNASAGLFQWFFNGEPIAGAHESTFIPAEEGTYHLHFIDFETGCEATSNELEFIITSTPDIKRNDLMIFPNPASDMIHIYFKEGKPIPAEASIQLIDIGGRQMSSPTVNGGQVDISHLPPGIYTIRINTGEKVNTGKFIIRDL